MDAENRGQQGRGPDNLLLFSQAKSVAEKLGDAGPVDQN